MKASFYAAICGCLFTSSVYAVDYTGQDHWYIGYQMGTGTGHDRVDGGIEAEEDFEHTNSQLTLGAVGKEGVRFEISYSKFYLEYDVDGSDEALAGWDFDLIVPFTQARVRPYLTAGLGVYKYEGTGDFFTSRDGNVGGHAINAGAGILVYVIEELELDVSYRYKRVSWEHFTVGGEDVNWVTPMSGLQFGGRLMF